METRPILDDAVAKAALPAERLLAPLPIVSPPLVVDLDGTILKTDLLIESLLVLVKQNPLFLFLLPFWLLKGRAYLKRQIASRIHLDTSTLPYRADFVAHLKAEHERGRSLVLATAADDQLARQVADYLGIFDLILASDGMTNLAGESKRDRLVSIFGERGFDYAANGFSDLPVWSSARKAIVANRGPLFQLWAARKTQIERVFRRPKLGLADFLKPLRLRHWLKNLLVFVPLFAAHRYFETALLLKAILAFVAFGCCASGGYVFNDLFDLATDRHHPDKRLRAFASGNLPLTYGLAIIPVLLGLGCAIALKVSPLFLGVLLIYVFLTMAYSLYVRKVVLLDVIFLAGLYSMRIMAGSAAIGVRPSQWLLAFSTFLFFSLALVKRYGELVIMKRQDGDHAKSRGYELGDGELLAAMGAASGYVAVLVLALYVESDTAQSIYGRPELMWFICPLLLYWVSHIWLFAHRGKMPDDPVVFATHDRVSCVLIALMVAITLLAL